jgi:hypothetical protein
VRPAFQLARAGDQRQLSTVPDLNLADFDDSIGIHRGNLTSVGTSFEIKGDKHSQLILL